jgi:hypothetical protein
MQLSSPSEEKALVVKHAVKFSHSPVLIWMCILSPMQIKKANFRDENFSVSVSKSANEVVATYTKDETGMDLVIRLPASYPLKPVDVDCARSLGISEVKQRKWLMSMMLFVRNQVTCYSSVLYFAIGFCCSLFCTMPRSIKTLFELKLQI